MTKSTNFKLHYPSYLERWHKNKPRKYPDKELVVESYKAMGLTNKLERNDLQKHHIDWDRSNDNVENIALLTPEEHEQAHSQLIQYITKIIQLGKIKFDHANPHYYVADTKLRKELEDLRQIEKQESKIDQAGLTDFDLYVLQNKYSNFPIN